MKKRILIGALTVLAAAALAVGIIGCEITLALSTDIDGKVVNAKASGDSQYWWTDGSDSTVGLEVGLYPETSSGFSDTPSRTGTVDSAGSFDFSSVAQGRYKLKGTDDPDNAGWIFVPRIISISGNDMVLPTLIAYPNPTGAADDDLIIFLSWESTDHDLDAHLTYNNGTTRDDVYWEYPTSSPGDIELERDIRDDSIHNASYPRVETMVVRTAPETGADNSGTIYDATSIPTNQMRFYVDCYNAATHSITGDTEQGQAPAWGQVDVMYGSAHYGTWVLPYNTNEDTLWVVTIDARLGNIYTVYSAGNVDYANIKSITDIDEDVMTAVPVDEIQ